MSASGALEMKTFSPLSRKPPPSGSASSAIAATSDPASGSVSAKAATASPEETRGIQTSDDLGATGGEDRMGAEPLECERRLGLRRISREAFANQAEGQRRDLVARLEHLGHEPVGSRAQRPAPG